MPSPSHDSDWQPVSTVLSPLQATWTRLAQSPVYSTMEVSYEAASQVSSVSDPSSAGVYENQTSWEPPQSR